MLAPLTLAFALGTIIGFGHSVLVLMVAVPLVLAATIAGAVASENGLELWTLAAVTVSLEAGFLTGCFAHSLWADRSKP